MSHTYAILEVSVVAFEEIKQKLEAAGYWQAFHEGSGGFVIDMQGIAVRATKEKVHE